MDPYSTDSTLRSQPASFGSRRNQKARCTCLCGSAVPVTESTAVPVQVVPPVLVITMWYVSAYDPGNSNAQLRPDPPPAPLLQLSSVEVVPAMKLENTPWMIELEPESGRGWPAYPTSD
jgi:hypothetical protein